MLYTRDVGKGKEERRAKFNHIKNIPIPQRVTFFPRGKQKHSMFSFLSQNCDFPGVTVIAILFFPDPQISPAGKAGSLIMS